MTEAAAHIKKYWDDQALNSSLEEALVTHRDRHQRMLEIELALQYLPRGQRILDVGCGNGFSTAIFSRYASEVLGIDYSQPMIDRARKNYQQLSNVRFEVQDVLSLKLPVESFDVAISQRCLINLPTWEQQGIALANIAHVLKPGGLFILQEGTRQGREHLNQLREKFGLARMPPVSYNLDFDEEVLWPFLDKYYEVVTVRRLGLYDLISRIVHPMLVSPVEPEYDAKINRIAAQVCMKLEGVGEIGREFSAVLRRRDDRNR